MQSNVTKAANAQHVVIVGGGFGGLYAAKNLANSPLHITLIDKRNFHLFQPLLYQVATGGLSPGDIASPLRAVLSKYHNISVIKAEVCDIDLEAKEVICNGPRLSFDFLIIAAGSRHHYFGNDDWADTAPGLKTIENAIEMRRKILQAFEAAELEQNPEDRRAWLTIAVIGSGPTGVELAGALAELAHHTLAGNFRNIDPSNTKILLIEASDRILSTYSLTLSDKASKELQRLGVEIRLNTTLDEIDGDKLILKQEKQRTSLRARTVLWAAGVKASPLADKIAGKYQIPQDGGGRLLVRPDLSLPGHSHVFVVGDMANLEGEDGTPLPGIAPVAMQQGRYVAKHIKNLIDDRKSGPFYYRDKGSLAVIGRNAAVAELGSWKLSGFPAWLIWIFIHIRYLIEFDNKIIVLFQWAWNYFTRKRGARLITAGEDIRQ